MLDAKKIYNKVKKYKIISFDIFDTLVKRNVTEPEMIFEIVQDKYNSLHHSKHINNFRDMRILAEQEMRKIKGTEEITLNEIYENLNSFDVQQKEELKSLEIDTEIKFSEPNLPVKRIYDQCLESGFKVVIISDMYLPECVILKILEKCCIQNFFKLYLSSSIKKKKSTGLLFDYVIQDLKIRSDEIIHLGDRKRADNLIPRLKGMSSVYINPCTVNTSFLTQKDFKKNKNIIFPFINNQLPKYEKESEAFRWGYEAFGPLLLGFCTWVHKCIIENNIKKIFSLHEI